MDAMDVLQKLAGPVTALLGALIGSLSTMRATNKAMKREAAREQRRDETEVQNLLDALGVEIGTLWGFHMRRIGALVEALEEGGALEFYYPLTQDYFTVYNSNAASIGRVRNAELREAVVVCYNKCKKVVDGFKYNNVLYRDYRDLLLMPPNSPNHEDYVAAKYQELKDFALLVKEDHFELKGYVEHLLNLLSKYQKRAHHSH